MSTPCGAHPLMTPARFNDRVNMWMDRTQGTTFRTVDFREAMDSARAGDLIYCDPPYVHSQTILYGAQSFQLEDLFHAIDRCLSRGARVALSIDGSKKSGKVLCPLEVPQELFCREITVNMGRSMLRRFQICLLYTSDAADE